MDYSQTGGDAFGVYGLQPSRKSRLVAFLLVLFFGMFGAHRFYAGKTATAITQLILSITVVGMLISGPWVCIDWIMIICGSFKDDMGRKIKRTTPLPYRGAGPCDNIGMKNDNFSGKRRSRSNGKRCPDCGTWSCFPLRFLNAFVSNRYICECGRIVDRNGQRIRPRVLR